MRISDWSSDVCSSDLTPPVQSYNDGVVIFSMIGTEVMTPYLVAAKSLHHHLKRGRMVIMDDGTLTDRDRSVLRQHRSEEHTSELQSLMRISYAVFCLKKKTNRTPS